MALALQQLDPAVCAQRIMDNFNTIQTIALEWDHRPHPSLFVAMVEEEAGDRSLRILDQQAASMSSHEIERAWKAGWLQHGTAPQR